MCILEELGALGLVYRGTSEGARRVRSWHRAVHTALGEELRRLCLRSPFHSSQVTWVDANGYQKHLERLIYWERDKVRSEVGRQGAFKVGCLLPGVWQFVQDVWNHDLFLVPKVVPWSTHPQRQAEGQTQDRSRQQNTAGWNQEQRWDEGWSREHSAEGWNQEQQWDEGWSRERSAEGWNQEQWWDKGWFSEQNAEGSSGVAQPPQRGRGQNAAGKGCLLALEDVHRRQGEDSDEPTEPLLAAEADPHAKAEGSVRARWSRQNAAEDLCKGKGAVGKGQHESGQESGKTDAGNVTAKAPPQPAPALTAASTTVNRPPTEADWERLRLSVSRVRAGLPR